jgi:hypothetical protein
MIINPYSFAVAPGGGPFGGLVSVTDLVEFWRLDEASGTRVGIHAGLDLTDNNTVTSNPGIGGVGTAAQFTSPNQEALTRADESALSTGNIDFTWIGWVYFTSLVAGGTWIAKADSNSAAATEFRLFYNNNTLQMRWDVSDASTFGSVSATLPSPPSTGTWYFVVVEHDSVNNLITIQINNGTVYSASWSNGCWDSTKPLRFGSWRPTNQFHDGRMQWTSFWKRILTAGEKTIHYNSGSGLDY